MGMMMSNEHDFTIVQITDTHLLANIESEFIGINPEQHFVEMLKQIRQQQPKIDLFIHTGDIVQEAKPMTYQRYMDAMSTFALPFYHTLGNHDNPEFFPYVGHQRGEICIVDLGLWQLILLNSAVVGRVDGRIETSQLEALSAQLTKTPEKPTILAFHHHPFTMQSHWIDEHRLKNADELLAVIAQFPQVKAVFHGHVHQASHTHWQGVDFYSTPATSIQFKPKSQKFALDDTPPAYRVICLTQDGQVETNLHYLKKYQVVDLTSQGY